MAASTLPAPGTRKKINGKWRGVGPCVAACRHHNCRETRDMAAAICPFCNKPIGYETKFYDDRCCISIPVHLRALVHAECLEKHLSGNR